MQKRAIEIVMIELCNLLFNIEESAKEVAYADIVDQEELQSLNMLHPQITHVLHDLLRSYSADNPELSVMIDQRLFEFDLVVFLKTKSINLSV